VASIRLEKLCKVFGPVQAVKELNLEIPDGKFAALLGPSGCGKTTTMNMIAGLETPSAGSIYFDDRRMNDVPPGKRGIGFVFQNYAIFTNMTVYDNLAFGPKVTHVAPEQIRARVQQVAELLQMTGMLKQNAGRLSVNDMQKVAIGRSMIMQPRIFLLDEPFSNLDAAFRAYMRGELKRIQREIGQTMVYVTHDQIEAMSMADKIAVMDFGVMQQFGSPDEVYNQPANTFVANFIGSPNMNLISCAYQVEQGVGYLAQKRGGTRLRVNGKRAALLAARADNSDLVLGIRPEHLHVSEQDAAIDGLPAVVQVVEPLGSKTIVYFRVGEDLVKAIASASYRAPVGATRWLQPAPDYLHVFDGKTGTAIR